MDALIGVNGFIGNPLGNQIWLNDGAGHFIDSQQVLGSSRTDRIALADVDNDGDLDLIAGNTPTQDKQVWLNDTTWQRVYLPIIRR